MMGLAPLYEEEERYISLFLHAHVRKGPVITQREGGWLHARKKILTGTRP